LANAQWPSAAAVAFVLHWLILLALFVDKRTIAAFSASAYLWCARLFCGGSAGSHDRLGVAVGTPSHQRNRGRDARIARSVLRVSLLPLLAHRDAAMAIAASFGLARAVMIALMAEKVVRVLTLRAPSRREVSAVVAVFPGRVRALPVVRAEDHDRSNYLDTGADGRCMTAGGRWPVVAASQSFAARIRAALDAAVSGRHLRVAGHSCLVAAAVPSFTPRSLSSTSPANTCSVLPRAGLRQFSRPSISR
jgi:hypothetical protein